MEKLEKFNKKEIEEVKLTEEEVTLVDDLRMQYFNEIEDFLSLDKEMTDEEVDAFEKKLQTNEEFANMFEEQKQFFHLFLNYKKHLLKNEFSS